MVFYEVVVTSKPHVRKSVCMVMSVFDVNRISEHAVIALACAVLLRCVVVYVCATRIINMNRPPLSLSRSPTAFWRLTEIMKQVAHEVVNGGGLVRAIHNHGIRETPVRMKAKSTDQLGQRYFEKGRFISVYMDCNPRVRESVHNILALDQDILRQTHLRARSLLDNVNLAKEKTNPFVQRYLRQKERKEMEQQQQKEQQQKQQQQQQAEQMTAEMPKSDS